jgi:hypothetical protein
MATFDPIVARLARATEQAVAVQNELMRFTESDAHKLVPEKNADGTEHYLRVHFEPQVDFVRAGILFGEFVHQLRSILDNLAWQLVLCSGNTPDSATEFPIFRNLDKFRRDAPRKMRGMEPAICAEIERYQPFKSRRNNPEATGLWFIHDIDIMDKHRVIVLVAMGTQKGKLSGFPTGSSLKQAARAEHGAIFVTVCLPAPMDRVSLKADLTFAVAINHGNALYEVSNLLRELLDEVDGIAENFRKFIEHP